MKPSAALEANRQAIRQAVQRFNTANPRVFGSIAALNIPSVKGTGDWHLIETFFQPRGSEGIHERK